MDLLAERLDAKLREWHANIAAEVRERKKRFDLSEGLVNFQSLHSACCFQFYFPK